MENMKIHFTLVSIKNMKYLYIQWKLAYATDREHMRQRSGLGFSATHSSSQSHAHKNISSQQSHRHSSSLPEHASLG